MLPCQVGGSDYALKFSLIGGVDFETLCPGGGNNGLVVWEEEGEGLRLLDSRTPANGVIFWVKDRARAYDNDFIEQSLEAEVERLPRSWIVANVAANPRSSLSITVLPSRDGGCEVQIDLALEAAPEQDGGLDNAWSFLQRG